jgi:flagellin FlaB
MKSNTRNDIQEDKIAAIGIGAMIVFIALILVAAVAAAVIIQTAEKLQQNAQTTGDDTADNMAGKLLVQQGFVATGGNGGSPAVMTPGEAYMFFVRLAPGSEPAPINEITFQFFCDNGVREGTIGDPAGPAVAAGAVALMDVADPTNAAQLLDSTTGIMEPSTGYVMWIDANGGQVGAANLGLNDCSPDSGDSKVEMYIHVGSGGTTFATLDIGTTTSGSLVI